MYQYLGEILLYDFVNIISGVFLILFNVFQFKRKKEILSGTSSYLLKIASKENDPKFLSSKTFYAVVEALIISVIQYLPIYSMTRKFGTLVGTGANYFGFILFIPFILFLLFYLLHISPLKQMDLITPAFPLALSISKLACFFHGCCNGIESAFGLYNHMTGKIEFPVQLVEAGLALLIFVFFMLWRKKAKEGTLFPVYLILMSGTRFFSEFLRHEPNVIWIFKTYHILCIIGFVLGLIYLFIVLKFGTRISEFFEAKNKAYLDKKLNVYYKEHPQAQRHNHKKH